jgi:fructosamine-3-kinase
VSLLPGDLGAAVEAAVRARIVASERVGGGDVNLAFRLGLEDGRTIFVKHSPRAPPGAYSAEAAGLAWLAEAGAVRTPRILAVGDESGARFLSLEWIERAVAPMDAPIAKALGRSLAALHRFGAEAFGLAQDNLIAGLPQQNAPCGTWAEFYATRRLEPLARRAVASGSLPPGFLTRLERLRARLDELCGPREPPARLHGDLWNGNVLVARDGQPVLIDPAVYGGHREVDLAMMRLFGGFPEEAFAAYAEVHPLAEGHERRVELFQLAPILVHVCLFGGGYARSAERIMARYLTGAAG